MKIYLSLVLACFNEAEHLKTSYTTLLTFLKKINRPFEIIFVDDKSKDHTISIIRSLIKSRPDIPTVLITHSKNFGRGKSVTDGLDVAQGEIAGYIDADLEISPEYIQPALHCLLKNDFVVGKRDYVFTFRLIHRYIATKVYALFVKKLFHLPVSDTESGFKFFHRSKILSVLKKAKNPGWFWDTEIVFYAVKMGLTVCEIPLVYKKKFSKKSTVHTIKDSTEYLINLISLFLKNR
ncbi:hypothetical protein A3C23_00790 [Candidatus Roizmanbacteria bacterium RIFCSPHIGHO2_02_FULL_37_13b]|uniref:Glycosyltransferase 2-like domain-containing protein n=1 Tax=Candidatus Roizmanbacteria bacterium RIFCSPLOWO2_02_FULL_36_11 TaxID=1802071 RepID=A0A1F7JD60_9BACT|nr:MAG: hypothetical protein A3C23_00790 [Candidatus Roizmanbacteria bacterium RIFCSPHIGHO2_02_FULL_37_13b]OGK53534.1 MAG: hypothetical protein A3H78_04900 [Candidatus Roizmanbacteria bacterium RIFCSPLOWO2_02_FULL_36_11]